MKTIGVLTSGGDAPGMNAAVYAVAKTALANGVKCYGIKYSYWGLANDIDNCLIEFNANNIGEILNRGGSFLRSMRFVGFHLEENMKLAIDAAKAKGIEGLVVIGGDGSFKGARDLSNRGLPCVGIPGTIDNDISCTDFTLGYDTCLNTIKNMCDGLYDSISSNDRCMVVEIMGNHCSDLTINSAVSCGADVLVVREKMEEIGGNATKYVVDRLREVRKAREEQAAAMGSKDVKKYYLVTVMEKIDGVNIAEIADAIHEELGIESRSLVFGHLQRGGKPSAFDTIMGCRMGNKAVKLLMEGIGNRVVARKGNDIVDYEINEGLAMERRFDENLYQIALELSK